ncbi:hypothetical protein TGAM01_v205260 [Trichoderma gamsii]|uniref:Uncharacterized protein n=1 Tax=Trichoderma gamsii TaxID=398673 RepID=A0A2P4ZNF8_9HYPO|nr:hypothetical protein TGAM01_v205260 [Trichoderma gamsii]PON25823.1 hypothetical protein TGAM01_v205260 [Trichoderma gamsii]
MQHSHQIKPLQAEYFRSGISSSIHGGRLSSKGRVATFLLSSCLVIEDAIIVSICVREIPKRGL